MSDGEYGDDYGDLPDDARGQYTMEEYDVGPSNQQVGAAETAAIDFRMDAPPPSAGGGSMEQRLRHAGDLAPPEGMQLARPSAAACCASGAPSSHTGPKAVKADYEAAKQIMRDQRMRAGLERERTLQPQKLVTQADLQMSAEEKRAMQQANKKSDDEDEDDEDAADAAAFEKYKQERIAFVQNSLPRFGTYERVSKSEFARLVKSVHELVHVVCLLYQTSMESCIRLSLSFEALAPQFPHVKFVRLRARDAMPNFSPAGLPAILVYKGGQLLSSALRVTDVLPKHFTDVDVARLLQAKGILSVPTGLQDRSSSRSAAELARDFSDDENAAAEAENKGGAVMSGLDLFAGIEGGGGSSSSSSASASRARGGGGKLQRGKISSHRAANSGSDSD